MAVDRKDSVADTTTTVGTGTLTLTGISPIGFRPFSNNITDGATVRYRVSSLDLSEWEDNSGVWDNTAKTLTRGVPSASSNAGNLVSFSAGTKFVTHCISVADFNADSIVNTPAGGIAATTVQGAINELDAEKLNKTDSYGRNLLINGRMEIDQINNGAAVTPVTTGYVIDNVKIVMSQASKLIFQQVNDAPAGFINSLEITVDSQYSPLASDTFHAAMFIPGKDMANCAFGAAGAAVITLSQQIKGSVAGTYAVSLRNGAADRSYVGTISVTTSWAPVSITLTGDITGTWATDSTLGMYVSFDLGSGSNLATTAGSWQAGNYLRTSGSVTFVNQTAGSTLNITGVQLEKGSIATESEFRMNELELCQKRYEESDVATGALVLGGYAGAAGALFYSTYNYKVRKEAAPTVTVVGTWAATNCAQPTVASPGNNSVRLFAAAVAGGNAFVYSNDADNKIIIDARY